MYDHKTTMTTPSGASKLLLTAGKQLYKLEKEGQKFQGRLS